MQSGSVSEWSLDAHTLATGESKTQLSAMPSIRLILESPEPFISRNRIA